MPDPLSNQSLLWVRIHVLCGTCRCPSATRLLLCYILYDVPFYCTWYCHYIAVPFKRALATTTVHYWLLPWIHVEANSQLRWRDRWGNHNHVCMYGHTSSKSKDQPGKAANPARGQLNRENEYAPVPFRAWEFGLARRVRQSRPASACSSPYPGWIWCSLKGFLPSSAAASSYLFKPRYAIGSVPCLSGHAIAYRWRSLPRVRRHKASTPKGSSGNGCCLCITMDQLMFAPLFSHSL